MTFTFSALRIDFTDQEILDDLMYPARPEGAGR